MQDATATTQISTEAFPIQEPIVLTPGLDEKVKKSKPKTGRGAFSTLGILLAGWFFGNLILVGLLSIVVMVSASSTGLIKVPFFTEKFFGKSLSTSVAADVTGLESAEAKIAEINTLSSNKTIKSLQFTQDEINALFANQVEQKGSFPLYDPKIVIKDGKFVFSAKMIQTNAPVTIAGNVTSSGLIANIELTSAKFGKVSLPTFLASNLFDSYLSQIGLSLSGSQVPAKQITLENGSVTLVSVSKP